MARARDAAARARTAHGCSPTRCCDHRVAHLRRHTPPPRRLRGSVDAVLLSHVHHDHLHKRSLRDVAGPGTVAVVPSGAAELLAGIPFGAVREVVAGDIVDVAGIAVRTVEAWHDGRRRPGARPAHTVGYVADRVWFAGDTELHPRMELLRDEVDVALLPIWGWGPTPRPGPSRPRRGGEGRGAGPDPRSSIPIHWGTFLPVGLGARHRGALGDPAGGVRGSGRLGRSRDAGGDALARRLAHRVGLVPERREPAAHDPVDVRRADDRPPRATAGRRAAARTGATGCRRSRRASRRAPRRPRPRSSSSQ